MTFKYGQECGAEGWYREGYRRPYLPGYPYIPRYGPIYPDMA